MKLQSLIKTTTAALALSVAFALSTARADNGGIPKTYPLKKCVVSNDPLGEHGKPVKVTYEGTDVYLCCKDCLKDWKKDPAKYVKMVKDEPPKK